MISKKIKDENKGKSRQELQKVVEGLRKELVEARLNLKMGREKDVRKVGKIRRKIAYLLTVAREGELNMEAMEVEKELSKIREEKAEKKSGNKDDKKMNKKVEKEN